MKDDKDALGYLYIINELYNNGIKSIKPSLEQCLAFENIEINIPFSSYQQPYETMIIEFPQEYRSILESRYKVRAPLSVICHKNNNYLIGALSFGVKNYNITFFITNPDTIIEELIQVCDPNNSMPIRDHNIVITNKDLDFLPVKQAEHVVLNIMLFATNFGSKKIGYENIKQHRFHVRKKPNLAREDFYYYGLNQEIKLFEKKIVKNIEDGTHASPHPHWRKGHWRLQHHGINNSLIKIIFIKAVFVCDERYKGNMSDTQVSYI